MPPKHTEKTCRVSPLLSLAEGEREEEEGRSAEHLEFVHRADGL